MVSNEQRNSKWKIFCKHGKPYSSMNSDAAILEQQSPGALATLQRAEIEKCGLLSRRQTSRQSDRTFHSAESDRLCRLQIDAVEKVRGGLPIENPSVAGRAHVLAIQPLHRFKRLLGRAAPEHHVAEFTCNAAGVIDLAIHARHDLDAAGAQIARVLVGRKSRGVVA